MSAQSYSSTARCARPWSVTAAALFLMLGGVAAFADLPDDLPSCLDPGASPPCWVLPSDTDDHPGLADCPDDDPDHPLGAIGCENQWPDDNALNKEHYLYLPGSWTDGGKLLVFFGGGNGSARACEHVCPIAAQQGYHVIALTYPAAKANGPCGDPGDLPSQERRDCFGNAFYEVVTGKDRSPLPGSTVSTVSEHDQDSIVNRLFRVLQWAHARYPDDGWGRYLTTTGVDWTRVHLSGHSNGTSHSSFMGTLPEFRSIGRVALFAGPDDGEGGTTEDAWNPATYIQEQGPDADTATRYYGLVHVLNKARNLNNGNEVHPPPIYQVLKNWTAFGMDWPNNSGRFDDYNPEPGDTPDFGDAHMLISIDPERPVANATDLGTTKGEAHGSVIKDVYCSEEDAVYDCTTYGNTKIGYEPAWRCILGAGDVSAAPTANAGPDQLLECQGGGGATVQLDGSGSRDADCDVMRYTWTGPFPTVTGRKPSVFAPLGSNTISLVVDDPWSPSSPDTTLITVRDTKPPSLHVTLTPTVLWPPDHRLVRVDATISATDTCGAQPQVVLTSITSDQPDDGVADGDTVNDIQEGAIGTLDGSFLLRAERAGNNPSGRTYTVTYTATDASGNWTRTSATVHVPHSQ